MMKTIILLKNTLILLVGIVSKNWLSVEKYRDFVSPKVQTMILSSTSKENIIVMTEVGIPASSEVSLRKETKYNARYISPVIIANLSTANIVLNNADLKLLKQEKSTLSFICISVRVSKLGILSPFN